LAWFLSVRGGCWRIRFCLKCQAGFGFSGPADLNQGMFFGEPYNISPTKILLTQHDRRLLKFSEKTFEIVGLSFQPNNKKKLR
jgi:hypothetical protein